MAVVGMETPRGPRFSSRHRAGRGRAVDAGESRAARAARDAVAGSGWRDVAPLLASAAIYLSALGAGLGAATALAEADGPDFYRVVDVAADDVLNIRAEPDASAQKVGSIPPGADCVRNLGCRGGLSFEEFTTLDDAEKASRLKENPRWCRIEYRGTTGWVAGRYLAEGACSE